MKRRMYTHISTNAYLPGGTDADWQPKSSQPCVLRAETKSLAGAQQIRGRPGIFLPDRPLFMVLLLRPSGDEALTIAGNTLDPAHGCILASAQTVSKLLFALLGTSRINGLIVRVHGRSLHFMHGRLQTDGGCSYRTNINQRCRRGNNGGRSGLLDIGPKNREPLFYSDERLDGFEHLLADTGNLH